MSGSQFPHGLVDEVIAHLSVTWDAQASFQALHHVREDSSIVAAGKGECVRVDIRGSASSDFAGPHPMRSSTVL